MAFDVIGVGTADNDGTGDTFRASFTKVNANFVKAVEGPASTVTADRLAIFDGTTGKLVKQAAFAESDVARLSQAQTLTGVKTFNANVIVGSTGNLTVIGSGGLGYGTGSGGAVTQLTSRTTAVELNKTNGAITLFSDDGDPTAPTSFTVTNSTVAATDTVVVSQKSGTDKYIVAVTAVGAGSFQITFQTFAGTTTEQPVFNFAVIKAVAA